MANLVLLYNLKPGVTKDQFENWTRTTDYPNMRGLKRVSSFVTHRVEKKLIGAGAPSVQYIETFQIDDLDGFVAEGTEEPEACPKGHRNDDAELNAPAGVTSAEEAEVTA